MTPALRGGLKSCLGFGGDFSAPRLGKFHVETQRCEAGEVPRVYRAQNLTWLLLFFLVGCSDFESCPITADSTGPAAPPPGLLLSEVAKSSSPEFFCYPPLWSSVIFTGYAPPTPPTREVRRGQLVLNDPTPGF